MPGELSRRRLLAWTLTALPGLAACGLRRGAAPETPTPTPEPAPPAASPTPMPPNPTATPIPRPSVIGRVTPPPTATVVPGRPGRLALALDGEPWLGQVGIFLARERGYFQEAGLDVHFVVCASREAAMRMLVGGQVEVSLVGGLDVMRARSEGAPVLSLLPVVPRPQVALIARQGVVARPRDLAGRRVAYPDDRTARVVLEAILRGDGLEPARVTAAPLPADPIGALAAGQIDALGGYAVREGPALDLRGAPPALFRPEQFGVPDYDELVVATRDELKAQRGPALTAFVGAAIRGYLDFPRDPARAIDTLVRADSDVDRRAMERGLPELAALWREPPVAETAREERWRGAARFLAERGLVRPDFDATTALVQDYLPRPPTPTPRPTAPPTATPAPTQPPAAPRPANPIPTPTGAAPPTVGPPAPGGPSPAVQAPTPQPASPPPPAGAQPAPTAPQAAAPAAPAQPPAAAPSQPAPAAQPVAPPKLAPLPAATAARP